MALRGVRQIVSARGGAPLCVFLVDGAADRPAAASCAIGDRAFGLAGGDDGKAWEVQQNSGGRRWVDVTPGAASFSPPDDNATDSGDATHRWQDVWVGRRLANSGSINVRLGVAGSASLSVTNPTGTDANVYADGTLRWANSNLSAFYGQFGGGPFTAVRTFTFPDASGDVMVNVGGTYSYGAGNVTIDVAGGLTRQFIITNSTPGQACDLRVNGTVRFLGGASFITALSSSATADRAATFPDASGVVVYEAHPATLSAKTLSRSRKASLTVAAINALGSPAAGEEAYASDGRKPGEGGGSGTGVPAFYDGSGWRSACDGTALAA